MRKMGLEISGNEESLKDELLELLVAGLDTTATAKSWALKYLADNPSIQTSPRNELLVVFPERKHSLPLVSAVIDANIPYRDAFINETLRMSNTGPVSFRETSTDYNILRYTIPAQTLTILITGGQSYSQSLNPFEIEEARRSPSSQARVSSPEWAVYGPDLT